MTDRPILFADAMVRAILRGEKTRSRRPASAPLAKSQPGDRLWVREALVRHEISNELRYRSDDSLVPRELIPSDFSDLRRQIPSIHMPRWASRLTLTVDKVTRERLQEVNHQEAMLEGVSAWADSQTSLAGTIKKGGSEALFAELWDTLYGQTSNRWAVNPCVVVLEFSVQHRLMDTAFGV